MKNNTKNLSNLGKISFNIERITSSMKLSNQFLSKVDVNLGHIEDDWLKDMLTANIEGYLYSHFAEEQTITYYCDRPKFLDWLLRRRKTLRYKVTGKDILKNPPIIKNKTQRLYIIEDLNNEFN